MAATTVPTLLGNLAAQLRTRPVLVGPPVVPVHLINAGPTSEAEAIIWTRATMAGARLLGWGAGAASMATVEPLTLAGWLYTTLPGESDSDAAAALVRAGVLLTEIAQQLRDDPTVLGALTAAAAPPTRWQPPLMTSAVWGSWRTAVEGSAVTRVSVDFSIAWQATT